MSLSDRLRPGSEAAGWVIEEVKRMEHEIKQLQVLLHDCQDYIIRDDSFCLDDSCPECAMGRLADRIELAIGKRT